MSKNRAAAVFSGLFVILASAWKLIQFVFDAVSTPENSSKLWMTLISAPALIPWVILVASLATLTWCVWPNPKRRMIAVESDALFAPRGNNLVPRNSTADSLIAAKARSNEAAMDRLMFADKWLPLHEALYYLVYDSQWAENQSAAKNEAEFDSRISMELRERLARGEIASRGKLGASADSLTRATEPIPPDFWINAFIQPHGEIVLMQDNRCVACTNGGGGPSYRAIILRKQDVEAVWPRRNGSGLTSISLSVDALRTKVILESQTANAIR